MFLRRCASKTWCPPTRQLPGPSSDSVPGHVPCTGGRIPEREAGRRRGGRGGNLPSRSLEDHPEPEGGRLSSAASPFRCRLRLSTAQLERCRCRLRRGPREVGGGRKCRARSAALGLWPPPPPPPPPKDESLCCARHSPARLESVPVAPLCFVVPRPHSLLLPVSVSFPTLPAAAATTSRPCDPLWIPERSRVPQGVPRSVRPPSGPTCGSSAHRVRAEQSRASSRPSRRRTMS